MEPKGISLSAGSFHIAGYPDAVKLAAITGEMAKQLADLAAHRLDLEFSHDAAVRLRETQQDPSVVREALWRSAIISYWKCFDTTSKRRALRAGDIYEDGLPQEAFAFFKRLRNKDVAHDDRIFSSFAIGAVIGPNDADRKVAEILFIGMKAAHLDEPTLTNLGLLIEQALAWVTDRFEAVAAEKVRAMRDMPYQELLGLPDTEIAPIRSMTHQR